MGRKASTVKVETIEALSLLRRKQSRKGKALPEITGLQTAGHHEGLGSLQVPVRLPDVQRVRIRDASLLRLFLQEVKEVLDGQRGLVFTDAQNSLEQVVEELL